MVMKDLKEMFRDNKGDEDDEKDDTLFNLVRGEKKKASKLFGHLG